MPDYPYYLAVFLPLFAMSSNVQEVSSLSVVRLVIGALALTALVQYVARQYIKDCHTATAITGLYALGFYVGPLVNVVLPIYIAMIGTAMHFKRLRVLNELLNIITSVMTVVLAAPILMTFIVRDFSGLSWVGVSAKAAATAPDIYFIVLDSYTTDDILLERFGVDNSDFRSSLSELGFVTGRCVSPATKTDLSLSAYLNAGEPTGKWQDIRHSKLRKMLEAQGYESVAFSTGWVWSEIRDADHFYSAKPIPVLEFEAYVLDKTFIKYLMPLDNHLREMTRAHTINLFANLANGATNGTPEFIFAHIVKPHPPFVFDADGSQSTMPKNESFYFPNDEAYYIEGYARQAQYVAAALLPELQKIIQVSPESMIIITGDHGAWFSEGADEKAVFCASYNLPDKDAFKNVEYLLGETR